MTIRYGNLPLHMQQGARLYVEHGVVGYGVYGGSFFTAVMENDLMQAFAKADEANTARMRDWAAWLFLEAPSACHGSPAKVAAWIAHNGMEGTDNAP